MFKRMSIEDLKNGETNVLFWNTGASPIDWGLENENKQLYKKLNSYFNKERKYLIPTGDGIDEHEEKTAKPVDDYPYFELSLNTLMRNINVKLIKYLGETE